MIAAIVTAAILTVNRRRVERSVRMAENTPRL